MEKENSFEIDIKFLISLFSVKWKLDEVQEDTNNSALKKLQKFITHSNFINLVSLKPDVETFLTICVFCSGSNS